MIYICAGHTNKKGKTYDSGAVAKHGEKEYRESELTVDLRNAIVSWLTGYNATTDKPVKFKTDEDDWNYSQTIANAKTTEKDVLLDIHFNAVTAAATGVETFIPKKHTIQEITHATQLTKDLAKIMGIAKRGVKREDQCRHGSLGIMRPNGMNFLLEVCFITNATDIEKYELNKSKVVECIGNWLVVTEHEFTDEIKANKDEKPAENTINK